MEGIVTGAVTGVVNRFARQQGPARGVNQIIRLDILSQLEQMEAADDGIKYKKYQEMRNIKI